MQIGCYRIITDVFIVSIHNSCTNCCIKSGKIGSIAAVCDRFCITAYRNIVIRSHLFPGTNTTVDNINTVV